jgi:DNA-binding SARP family transcriptional activator
MLGYLLLHPGASQPREPLAGLLWPESSAAQSRKYLRQVLWQLQTALGESLASGDSRLLVSDGDRVGINLEASLWLDVRAFESACAAARGVSARDLDAAGARVLMDAVELYQGDLLEGCYQDWCLYERERLQQLYLGALDRLMDYSEIHGEYEAGLAYGSRILRLDCARERTHRGMMRLYHLSGDRTAALRQYERCAATLKKELGVLPAAQTTTLYNTLRADRFTPVRAVPIEQEAPAPALTVLTAVLDHLKQIRGGVTILRRQVTEDISAVEELLGSLSSPALEPRPALELDETFAQDDRTDARADAHRPHA